MADSNLLNKDTDNTKTGALIVQNGSGNKLSTCAKDQKYGEPPDGGTRAILVMLSAFLCNSILFGIINTWGTIYVALQKQLESQGDKEASSKACMYDTTKRIIFLLSIFMCLIPSTLLLTE